MATTTQMIQRKGSGIEGGPANLDTSHTMKMTIPAMIAKVMSHERMDEPPTDTMGARTARVFIRMNRRWLTVRSSSR